MAFADPELSGLRYLRKEEIAELLGWEQNRPYPWIESHFAEALISPTSKILVDEEKGHIVGYAAVQIVGAEAYLQNIAVSPALRRKGAGSKILQKVMMWAKLSHASSLHLDVEAGNAAALGLYNKAGFQVLEHRKKSYPRGEDAVLMRKFL